MPTTSLGIRYPSPYDTVDATSWQNLASDVDGLLTALGTKRDAALKPSSARVLGPGTQTVPATTPTVVTYTIEEWDVGGIANLGVNNDRLTLTPGFWYVQGMIWYDGITNPNHTEVDITLNTVQVAQNRIGPIYSGYCMQAAILIPVTTAGDFVQMVAGWSGAGGPSTLIRATMDAIKLRNLP
jgi:hypothetical protein